MEAKIFFANFADKNQFGRNEYSTSPHNHIRSSPGSNTAAGLLLQWSGKSEGRQMVTIGEDAHKEKGGQAYARADYSRQGRLPFSQAERG